MLWLRAGRVAKCQPSLYSFIQSQSRFCDFGFVIRSNECERKVMTWRLWRKSWCLLNYSSLLNYSNSNVCLREEILIWKKWKMRTIPTGTISPGQITFKDETISSWILLCQFLKPTSSIPMYRIYPIGAHQHHPWLLVIVPRLESKTIY